MSLRPPPPLRHNVNVHLTDCYGGWLERTRVREELLRVPRRPGESELQARWFSGEFGREFQSVTGELIRIVQFGTWNREPGPDFSDAAISINGGAPLRGSIELDPHASDWERHGHATNPAYAHVVLHVFLERGRTDFFTRTCEHRNVPQIQLDLETFAAAERWEELPIAKPGRCLAPLRDFSEARVREIIEGAAQYRLQRKIIRLNRMRDLHGEDEALFQALAETLGYKSNKLPFLLLAQRLPLRTLAGSKSAAAALLFGISGFLQEPDPGKLEPGARRYLRELWAIWWAERAQWERLRIVPRLWNFAGQRPVNHPQRRLAALLQMVMQWPKLRNLARKNDVARINRFFDALCDPFWDFHYTLTSRPSATQMALVGEARRVDMLANVFLPLAISRDASRWSDFRELRAPLANKPVEIAAVRLFGPGGSGRQWMKTVAHQQGLLQIHDDFCQQDDSDCARCPFPEQISKWPSPL